MAYFGTQRSLLPGRGIVTDPKGKKPDSDHPHEDDLSLDLSSELEGLPAAGGEHPPHDPSLSASTEEFQFSGPAEELDFTEPADFAFPTEQPASDQSGSFVAGEHVGAEQAFGAEEGSPAESPLPEETAAEAEMAGEGIADLEIAEESAEKEPKPKFELPAWARIAEWVTIGVLAAGALLAVIISSIWVEKNPKQVTLILNIACPVLLGLIPYALWRSMRAG